MKFAIVLLLSLLTFDSGETFQAPSEGYLQTGPNIFYQMFRLKKAVPSGSNRLLVITEPTWCPPCRLLDPVLKKLRNEGYDIHEYTQDKWYRAKGKPKGLPEKLMREGQRVGVPSLLFVEVDKKKNIVKHWKRGWSNRDTEKYIKKHLTK